MSLTEQNRPPHTLDTLVHKTVPGVVQILTDPKGHLLWDQAPVHRQASWAETMGLPSDFDPHNVTLINAKVDNLKKNQPTIIFLAEKTPVHQSSDTLILKAHQINYNPQHLQVTGQTVALKARILNPSSHTILDIDQLERVLKAEAQTQAKLESRYIAPIKDIYRIPHPIPYPYIDQKPETLVFSMRYFSPDTNPNLRQRLKTLTIAGKRLHPLTALTISNETAKALDYAHKQNVIHADLKPGNIILGEDYHTWVTDFGIANRVQELMNLKGFVLGSPLYVSPEVVIGHPVSPQSDLYGLGSVTYEMLTGESIIPENLTPEEAAIRSARTDGLTNKQKNTLNNLGLSPTIDPINRMLKRKPQHRYDTGQSFIQEMSDNLVSSTTNKQTQRAILHSLG